MSAEVDRLRARLAELEAELAEWRRQARESDGEDAQLQRRVRALQLGLTPAQFAVLDVLLRRRGRFVSRETLADACLSETSSPKVVDQHVCRIRKVIGPASIETAWGQGWRLPIQVAESLDRELAQQATALVLARCGVPMTSASAAKGRA